MHEDGYSQRECQQYIPVIFSNTVQSLAAILKALGPLGLSYEDPSKEVSQYKLRNALIPGKDQLGRQNSFIIIIVVHQLNANIAV